MTMRAWLFQDHRQLQKLGTKACPWSVGWIDPEGKRRSKRVGSKSNAEKYRRKLEGELAAGTYQAKCRKTWAEFRTEYEAKILPRLAVASQLKARQTFAKFEELAKPKRMDSIKTQTIDDYVNKRSKERGVKKGSTVSSATVNIDLRTLKAAIRVAHEWGYLRDLPKFRMVKEMQKVPRYVTPVHFAAIYQACDVAERPNDGNFLPSDWWRALITTAQMTGWRIRELLCLRRDNVNLETGVAHLQADETKGKRAERLDLHPIVVDHLRLIVGFSPLIFDIGGRDKRFLYHEHERIQKKAKIFLPCEGDHEHTDACHAYGFHDYRRAFATENFERLAPDALQVLMRHKSYSTTQRYINMARQMERTVNNLYVPSFLQQTTPISEAN